MKRRASLLVAVLLSCTATHACAQSENDYGLIFGVVFGGALLVVVGGLIWFVRFLLRGRNSRENERFRSAGSAADAEHRLGE
jgi:Flp pilus assembly protein TadB